MSQVTLRPRIALTLGSDEARARDLVTKAHEQCFISNSVTTKVTVEASFEVR
jgi:organic hydroperoxide reductase OsmC/OhrA